MPVVTPDSPALFFWRGCPALRRRLFVRGEGFAHPVRLEAETAADIGRFRAAMGMAHAAAERRAGQGRR